MWSANSNWWSVKTKLRSGMGEHLGLADRAIPVPIGGVGVIAHRLSYGQSKLQPDAYSGMSRTRKRIAFPRLTRHSALFGLHAGKQRAATDPAGAKRPPGAGRVLPGTRWRPGRNGRRRFRVAEAMASAREAVRESAPSASPILSIRAVLGVHSDENCSQHPKNTEKHAEANRNRPPTPCRRHLGQFKNCPYAWRT